MDWEAFLTGIGILILSYLLYRFNKWSGTGREENARSITTFGNYISLWIWVVFGFIVGLVYIVSSLPSHI